MTGYLILFACAILILVLARIVRIFELSAELRGGPPAWIVTDRDNSTNGNMFLLFMLAFFGFCIWQFYSYKDLLLPVAASEEGQELDWLMNFNFLIITIVFVLVNFLLFYFAWKYRSVPGRVALFYPENHKLELLWTLVPGIVMAIIIVLGLRTWNKLQRDPVAAGEDYVLIELVSEQFKWTARYSGDDNKLGKSNFRLISTKNAIGIDASDPASEDDFIVYNEIHVPKGKRVLFSLRSKDVIHSAYFPHFRQQMNTVPGLQTQVHFLPTITTDSMRVITGNPEFQYILLCNKICGTAHYNMKLDIVVEEEDAFRKWYEEKKSKVIFKTDNAPVPVINTPAPADSLPVVSPDTAKKNP
ncbi:MAG: cytochrome c oxidase subunit II [Bacteroidia bacterium]|nr:cytochrome c oxidase subunit II [Bacteroidia bacterium]